MFPLTVAVDRWQLTGLLLVLLAFLMEPGLRQRFSTVLNSD